MKVIMYIAILLNTFTAVAQAQQLLDVYEFTTIKETANTWLKKYKASEILFVFDLDRTLIHPNHPATCLSGIAKFNKTYQEITGNLPKPKKELLQTHVYFFNGSCLVQDNIPSILSELEKDGVKSIVLTATRPGQLLNTGKLKEEVRFAQLKSLNIDFSRSFTNCEKLSLTDIQSSDNRNSLWYKGLLLSNGDDRKGDTLVSWLRKFYGDPLTLKAVCFVDDTKGNLEGVEIALKKSFPMIEYIGIEYKAHLNLFSKPEHTLTEKSFKDFWEKLVKEVDKLKALINPMGKKPQDKPRRSNTHESYGHASKLLAKCCSF